MGGEGGGEGGVWGAGGAGVQNKRVKKQEGRGRTWASVGLEAPESISSKRARILGIEILPGGK